MADGGRPSTTPPLLRSAHQPREHFTYHVDNKQEHETGSHQFLVVDWSGLVVTGSRSRCPPVARGGNRLLSRRWRTWRWLTGCWRGVGRVGAQRRRCYRAPSPVARSTAPVPSLVHVHRFWTFLGSDEPNLFAAVIANRHISLPCVNARISVNGVSLVLCIGICYITNSARRFHCAFITCYARGQISPNLNPISSASKHSAGVVPLHRPPSLRASPSHWLIASRSSSVGA